MDVNVEAGVEADTSGMREIAELRADAIQASPARDRFIPLGGAGYLRAALVAVETARDRCRVLRALRRQCERSGR